MEKSLGAAYVNDFEFNDRSYRVYVQADQQFRSNPGDVARYSVKTSAGRMMPLSNVVSIHETTAPKTINHYNLFRSAQSTGPAAQGYRPRHALAALAARSERLLPHGMT